MANANDDMGNNPSTKTHVITQDPIGPSESDSKDSCSSDGQRLSNSRNTTSTHKVTNKSDRSIEYTSKDSPLVNRNVFTNVLHANGDTVQHVHTPKDVSSLKGKPSLCNVS